jgi:hypothetical protein
MIASNPTSGPPKDEWAAQTGRCTECQFDWSETSYEILVGHCMQDVATFGEAMAARDPALPVAPGLWSASRYVWHTVDVLRFGTERLWTISVDASFGVPVWDENVVAGVRSYDSLSPVVGLIALIQAANAWKDAALEAPRDEHTPHPEAGTIDAFDVVQRNAHEVRHHLWDINGGQGRDHSSQAPSAR